MCVWRQSIADASVSDMLAARYATYDACRLTLYHVAR